MEKGSNTASFAGFVKGRKSLELQHREIERALLFGWSSRNGMATCKQFIEYQTIVKTSDEGLGTSPLQGVRGTCNYRCRYNPEIHAMEPAGPPEAKNYR